MNKSHLFVVVLFLLSVFVRVSINGFNMGYPGNLKAMDPMHHSLETEWIVEENEYGLMPYYLAQGHEDVISYLPPFLYLVSATFALIGGIPAYDSIYLLTCIISALAVPLLYLIGKRIFKSEIIGVIAAALYVIPLEVSVWLYGLYIGQWLMIVAFTFFLASIWLAWEFYKKPSWTTSLFLGLSLAGSFMTHFPETAMAVPIVLVLVGKMAWEGRLPIRSIGIAAVVPLICFALFFPNLPVYLAGPGSKPAGFGFYEISTNYHPGSLTDFPVWILLLAAVGGIYMFLNYRRLWFWGFVTIFSLLWMFVLPSFFTPSGYLVRQRFMTPFFILPIAGFGFYVLLREVKKRFEVNTFWVTVAVSFLVILVSFSSLNNLQERMTGKIITEDNYEALNWLSENTPEKSTVLFLNGFYQKSGFFSKRIPYQLYQGDVQLALETYFTEGEILTRFEDSNWINFFHEGPHKTSFFNIEYHGLKDKEPEMTTFDYVVMKDENQYFSEYNQAVIEMLSEEGYTEVYTKNGIHIVEAGK